MHHVNQYKICMLNHCKSINNDAVLTHCKRLHATSFATLHYGKRMYISNITQVTGTLLFYNTKTKYYIVPLLQINKLTGISQHTAGEFGFFCYSL